MHGFSTRPGGESLLESRSKTRQFERVLNLGFTEWDTRKHVLANRQKFFHGLGGEKMCAITLSQIHSDIIHRVNLADLDPAQEPRQGDALITRERGVLLVVQTADCVPILLADTKGRAVAAVHSGWRGTLQRIAEKTLGRMRIEFGTEPQDVVAALGPAIGRSCYEVGSEVVEQFAAKFADAREWFDGPFDALAAGENDPNWLPWLTMKTPGHAPPPMRAQFDLIAANLAI